VKKDDMARIWRIIETRFFRHWTCRMSVAIRTCKMVWQLGLGLRVEFATKLHLSPSKGSFHPETCCHLETSSRCSTFRYSTQVQAQHGCEVELLKMVSLRSSTLPADANLDSEEEKDERSPREETNTTLTTTFLIDDCESGECPAPTVTLTHISPSTPRVNKRTKSTSSSTSKKRPRRASETPTRYRRKLDRSFQDIQGWTYFIDIIYHLILLADTLTTLEEENKTLTQKLGTANG
jgi:hypothetical protein